MPIRAVEALASRGRQDRLGGGMSIQRKLDDRLSGRVFHDLSLWPSPIAADASKSIRHLRASACSATMAYQPTESIFRYRHSDVGAGKFGQKHLPSKDIPAAQDQMGTERIRRTIGDVDGRILPTLDLCASFRQKLSTRKAWKMECLGRATRLRVGGRVRILRCRQQTWFLCSLFFTESCLAGMPDWPEETSHPSFWTILIIVVIGILLKLRG